MNWDYLAGFFDGEGSCGSYTYGKVAPRFMIVNVHRGVLEQIRDFLGAGSIYTRQMVAGRQQVYALSIYDGEVLRRILPELTPRSVVKRDQLERLYETVKDRPSQHPNFGKIAALGTEQVRSLYWDEGLTTTEIGRRLGVPGKSVAGFMQRRGIPTRTRGR